MNSKDAVKIGNAHLDALMDYTRTMVAANKVPAEKAPAFMSALSDVMMDTVSKFEGVADAVALAAAGSASKSAQKKEVVMPMTGSKAPKPAKARSPKSAKMRAKLLEAISDAEDSKVVHLPAMAIAARYVAPKRGVGRPRKDEPPVVMTPEQLEFDRAFLRDHPVLEGLTVENSVAPKTITVLFDGKALKMIKRHLVAKYGITFEDYQRIYGLPDDYPSVAPGYAEERSRHARTQGLGTDKVPKVKSKVVRLSEKASRRTVAA